MKTSSLFRRQAAQSPVAEQEPAFQPIHLGQDHSAIPFKPVHPAPALGPSSISCPFTPQRCPFGGACHACPPKMQAKLNIGQPGDRYEQEADLVAEQVMRMPEPQVQRKCSAPGCKDEEEKKLLQTKPADSAGNAQVDHPLIQSVLSSPGQPLDAGTRSFMEPRFGQDFSGVRVHTDGQAAESARAVNARAYTVGRDVVFGEGQYAPGSDEGKRLVAHELAHVGQQRGRVYRRISPEDVSGEMVGQLMTVTDDFNTGSFIVIAGQRVEILSWSNTSDIVHVQLGIPYIHAFEPFDIPKTFIRPIHGSSTLDRYSTGIDSTVSDIERGEARIAAERARQGGPRPGEIPRLDRLQRNRQRDLNRRLIQETMFNRFDRNIVNWVNHYNTQFATSGFDSLDPNLVKAMLFQESELGTSGQFMSVTPSNREMGIHNLGQVIDSSASALLIMMREMEPALISNYHLENITRDMANRPAGMSAEGFMWDYVAPSETQGFQDAVNDFYQTASGMLDTNYDFWIRTAVRWLFEKRGHVSSWAEAIRAYNGSGARARRYRDVVIRRRRDAAAATTSSSDFIPTR